MLRYAGTVIISSCLCLQSLFAFLARQHLLGELQQSNTHVLLELTISHWELSNNLQESERIFSIFAGAFVQPICKLRWQDQRIDARISTKLWKKTLLERLTGIFLLLLKRNFHLMLQELLPLGFALWRKRRIISKFSQDHHHSVDWASVQVLGWQ